MAASEGSYARAGYESAAAAAATKAGVAFGLIAAAYLAYHELIDYITQSARSKSRAPGWCTPEEHAALQLQVELLCKGSGAMKCKGDDTPATIQIKIQKRQACIQARERINQRCFLGGNAGHIEQLAEVKRLGQLLLDPSQSRNEGAILGVIYLNRIGDSGS